MRLLKLSAMLAAAALAISCNSTATTTPAASAAPAAGTTTVTVSDFKFEPAAVTIKAGDTVTWNFQGPTPHSSTSDDGSTDKWDSTVLGAGQTYSHTFATKGTYSYHCIPHANMKATITVQ